MRHAFAWALWRPYTTLTDAEFKSALLASETQRDQFGARYGKTTGYEFWLFHFYRTRAGWVLDSFAWNVQASQLFNLPH